MTRRNLTISVKINRNYGKHSVEFGMTEFVEVEHGQARRDAYTNLIKQLDDQIAIYEMTHLQSVSLPATTGQSVTTTDGTRNVTANALVIENKNGKRLVSLKCGEWQKFGVAIYNDTCLTDLELDSYEYGIHDLSQHNLTATVDMVNGKPKRVLSIK